MPIEILELVVKVTIHDDHQARHRPPSHPQQVTSLSLELKKDLFEEMMEQFSAKMRHKQER